MFSSSFSLNKDTSPQSISMMRLDGITGAIPFYRNLFSWKSKEPESASSTGSQMESNTYVVPSPSSGWKLFSRSSPVMSMAGSVDNLCALPTQKSSSCNVATECLASSTTALILENRPSYVPICFLFLGLNIIMC